MVATTAENLADLTALEKVEHWVATTAAMMVGKKAEVMADLTVEMMVYLTAELTADSTADLWVDWWVVSMAHKKAASMVD